jgi:diacylglycerol kinase family enzyme
MKSAGIDVLGLKFGAIINTSSGGCESESEAEMLGILNDAGVTNCKTWCGESDQIERAFAEACTGTDTYLLPLPGGTMNMLPRALYGDVSWQDALRTTLAAPVTKALSGGRTGDELFFVAAIVVAPG